MRTRQTGARRLNRRSTFSAGRTRTGRDGKQLSSIQQVLRTCPPEYFFRSADVYRLSCSGSMSLSSYTCTRMCHVHVLCGMFMCYVHVHVQTELAARAPCPCPHTPAHPFAMCMRACVCYRYEYVHMYTLTHICTYTETNL